MAVPRRQAAPGPAPTSYRCSICQGKAGQLPQTPRSSTLHELASRKPVVWPKLSGLVMPPAGPCELQSMLRTGNACVHGAFWVSECLRRGRGAIMWTPQPATCSKSRKRRCAWASVGEHEHTGRSAQPAVGQGHGQGGTLIKGWECQQHTPPHTECPHMPRSRPRSELAACPRPPAPVDLETSHLKNYMLKLR